jgi:hypothetical protein
MGSALGRRMKGPRFSSGRFAMIALRDKPVAYPDAYKNSEERRRRIRRILPSSLCPLHFLAWAPRRQRSLQGLHITPSPSISSVRPISKRR